MSDRLSHQQRSRIMSSIRRSNTRPERIVRSLAHNMGYRFRLHRKDLPGTPDIVFPSRAKIILVHGCFWHRHDCDAGRKKPATNVSYWKQKFARNLARDASVLKQLQELGWDVIIIWECDILKLPKETLAFRIKNFLNSS